MFLSYFVELCKILPKLTFLEKRTKDSKYDEFILKDFKIGKSQYHIGSIIISLMIYVICTTGLMIFFQFGLFSYFLGGIFAYIAYNYMLSTFNRHYDLKKDRLDTFLPLFNTFVELYQAILPKNSDHCLYFVKILSEFKSPVKKDFEKFMKLIQIGHLPEELLKNYSTYSNSLKKYIHDFLFTSFRPNTFQIKPFRDLEDVYVQFSKSLENRISLIFFF